MVSIETVRQLALSFPETDEHPHFDRQAFRVKKKIFATLSEKDMTVSLKLTLMDQSVFCAFDNTVIYPVPGGWGKYGNTNVLLAKADATTLKSALTMAWQNLAPKSKPAPRGKRKA